MFATSRMKKELSSWCHSVTGLRGLARKRALQIATELSGQQAYEIWSVMQVLENKSASEDLQGSVVEMATDLKRFPEAWKVVVFKGALYERLFGKRNR